MVDTTQRIFTPLYYSDSVTASSRSGNFRSFEQNGVAKLLSAVLLHEYACHCEKGLAAGPRGSALTSTSVDPASRCSPITSCSTT